MSETSTLFGVMQTREEEQEEKSKFNVWSFITDISKTKEYLYDDQTSRDYEPWIVNKSFSAHMDTFIHAEAMNRFHFLDKKLQHDYMFYAVPSKAKRYKPWLSKSKDDKKELKIMQDISRITGYNIQRTRQFWNILTDEQKTDFLNRYVYPDSNNNAKMTKK